MVRSTALVLLLITVGAAGALAEDPVPPDQQTEKPTDAAPKQTTPHHPGGIEWTATLAEAQAASAKDGRPVIAYFTFDT